MKIKYFFLLVILSFSYTVIYATENRSISANEIDQVFKALSVASWAESEKLSKELMMRDSPAQINLMGRLRYIYIFSITKRIEKYELSYDEVIKKLDFVKGKLIIQPWHPINSKGGKCFNQICISSENPSILHTTQSDNGGAQIYAFEYFYIGYPLDISSFDGQNGRLGGILKNIDINKNLKPALKEHSGITWFLRLHVENSFIHYSR